MKDYRCFKRGCMLNVEYECLCSSPSIYTCKIHVLNHIEAPNKDHELKSIFGEYCENAREVILLTKCDSSTIKDFNKKFKEEEKIQRNFRNIIVEEDLAEKFEILGSLKSSDLEIKLNRFCSACESDSSVHEKSVIQASIDIVNTYLGKLSLFSITKIDERTNLLIYNTEIESKASIVLDTPQILDWGACITQLPNGKLFCFSNCPPSGITLLIDENYRVQELPSGTACALSSAIYFNNNVYCFGGIDNENCLTLSNRFDLERNQWNELTPLPNGDSCCNSIIFNRSILISGWGNKNLLRYSIDSNSFSTIPYDFAERKRKILINAERLYLIECIFGSIYESEIGSDTSWRKIANYSKINFIITQTYCQYNKEEIYISCIGYGKFYCFKFNLNEKRLIKLTLEGAKECYNEATEKYPNNAYLCNYIGDQFYFEGFYEEAIEYYSKAIRINPNKGEYFKNKGNALLCLDRIEEAEECKIEAARFEHLKLNS